MPKTKTRLKRAIFITLAATFALSFFVGGIVGKTQAAAEGPSGITVVLGQSKITNYNPLVSDYWDYTKVPTENDLVHKLSISADGSMVRDDVQVDAVGEADSWWGGHVEYRSPETIKCNDIDFPTQTNTAAAQATNAIKAELKDKNCLAFPVPKAPLPGGYYLVTNETKTKAYSILHKNGNGSFGSFNATSGTLFYNYMMRPGLGGGSPIGAASTALQSCPPKVGVNNDAGLYTNCFFPSGGNFKGDDGNGLTINGGSSGAPNIVIKGSGDRPEITFTLKNTVKSTLTTGTLSGNYFYFIANNYPNLAIRVQNCSTDFPGTRLVATGSIESLDDDTYIDTSTANTNITRTGTAEVTINKDSLFDGLINKVYNKVDATKDISADNRTCPEHNFINLETTGQLGKWGVNISQRSEPVAAENPESGTCPSDIMTADFKFMEIFSAKSGALTGFACYGLRTFLGVGRALRHWIGSEKLKKVLDLHDLTSSGSLTVKMWKTIRDIINTLFVLSFMLMALITVVGPLIKTKLYDSWKVQKMLPTIVGAIFLVNFSLSIANFVVELSNAFNNMFLDQISKLDGLNNSMAFDNIGDKGLLIALIITIVALVYSCLMVYYYLILWVRVIAINILMVFAAIPYVGGVLPVKQVTDFTGKWWGWFSSWVFMGPLLCLFLFITVEAMSLAGTSTITDIDVEGIQSSYLYQDYGYRPIFAVATDNIVSFINGSSKTKVSVAYKPLFSVDTPAPSVSPTQYGPPTVTTVTPAPTTATIPPTAPGETNSGIMQYIIAIAVMVIGIKMSLSAVKEASKVVDSVVNKATGGKVKSLGEGLTAARKGAKNLTTFGADKLIGGDFKNTKGLRGAIARGVQKTLGGARTAKNLPSMIVGYGERNRAKAAEDAEKALSKGAVTAVLTGDLKKTQEKMEGYNLDKIRRIAENVDGKSSATEKLAAMKVLKDVADGKGKNRSDADMKKAKAMSDELAVMSGGRAGDDITKFKKDDFDRLQTSAISQGTLETASLAEDLAERDSVSALIADAQANTATSQASLKALQNIARDPTKVAGKSVDDQKEAKRALEEAFEVVDANGVPVKLNVSTVINKSLTITAKVVSSITNDQAASQILRMVESASQDPRIISMVGDDPSAIANYFQGKANRLQTLRRGGMSDDDFKKAVQAISPQFKNTVKDHNDAQRVLDEYLRVAGHYQGAVTGGGVGADADELDKIRGA